MARKDLITTISLKGRDFGKTFHLQEMSAVRAEKWAMKVFLALARGGVEIPDDISSAGMAGIAAMGLKAMAGLSFEDAEPLLDEMFSCVRIIPDPKRPEVIRALIDDDIEEVVTRLQLRKEIIMLHTNFSTAVEP